MQAITRLDDLLLIADLTTAERPLFEAAVEAVGAVILEARTEHEGHTQCFMSHLLKALEV